MVVVVGVDVRVEGVVAKSENLTIELEAPYPPVWYVRLIPIFVSELFLVGPKANSR